MHMRASLRSNPKWFFNEWGDPEKVLVEVGTFAGEFARLASKHFKMVHAIDPWDFKCMNDIRAGVAVKGDDKYEGLTGEKVEEYFDLNTANIPNIRKLKGYDHEFVGNFADKSIDVVYIDSIHTFDCVGLSILRWWPKLKSNGVMAGHDYSNMYPQVKDAVNIVADMTKRPVLKYADSSWALSPPRGGQ